MTTFKTLIIALLLCVTSVGCGGSDEDTIGGDQDSLLVRIVVQETNGSITVETYSNGCGADEIAHDRHVVRDCDAVAVKVTLCDEAPLCDAVVDAAAEAVKSCEKPDGGELTVEVSCGG